MLDSMSTAGPPIARRDIAIAVLFSVLSVPFILAAQDKGTSVDAGAAILILLAVVPVLWRRRAPLLAVAGTLVGTAIHVIAYGSITRCGLMLPLFFVEAFALGSVLDGGGALIGLGVLFAANVVLLSHDQAAGWGGLEVSLPICVAVWYVGRVVRSRSAMVDDLRTRNVELHEARDANARLQVATDRDRLSAELDDLLRTRLADLAQLAEAGTGPEELVRIEAESRSTLEQMRAVVGVLRADDDGGTAPQPTLTHLDALVLRAKGADAHLHVTGSPRALPAGLELSAYRVVEHLLAATDDAPGVEVGVDFGADALEVSVTGPSRRRDDGALERARERVALHRGTLQTATRGGRTEARAAFPVLATA